MIGTGPFKFVEWQRGDRIVGERNDDYWGDEAGLEDGDPPAAQHTPRASRRCCRATST